MGYISGYFTTRYFITGVGCCVGRSSGIGGTVGIIGCGGSGTGGTGGIAGIGVVGGAFICIPLADAGIITGSGFRLCRRYG
ncbi:hypothetical protein GEL27_03570 [Salmonella enterica]|nr:hypothetical protein [Salmonella enterica]EDJ0486836.1 hypothetical protein [Salmonella enterica]